jgi:hypothetical protein
MDIDFLKSIGVDDESLAGKILDQQKTEEGGLVSKRDELLGKVSDYKTRLSGFDGIDADEYREMKLKLDKINNADMLSRGDYDALVKKLTDNFTEKETGLSGANDALKKQLEDILIEGESLKAITEHGGNAKLLTPVIKNRIKAIDKDGELIVQVLGEDGLQGFTKDNKPLTISDLIEGMKADEVYAGAFDASGLSGSGAKGSKTVVTETDGKVFGSTRLARARNKS